MALPPLRVLSLCAGVGGIELGIRLAAPGSRAVGFVEWESFAAAVLVARMENSSLDRAPVWDDIATFDGKPWRGKVDLVTAGFPYQPFSAAGRRRGVEDERWLWPDLARIIGEVEPSLVFLENVPGLVLRGLRPILFDLARLGFDAEWDLFSAAEVGAPHRRQRFFLLAAHVDAREWWAGLADARCITSDGEQSRWGGGEGGAGSTDARSGGADVADAPDDGHERPGGAWGRRNGSPLRREYLADPDPPRPGSQRGTVMRPAVGDTPLGQFPPAPEDTDGWARVLAEMPEAQPALCRVAHGVSDGLVGPLRTDRLRALGNSVVPLTVALALTTLWERLNDG